MSLDFVKEAFNIGGTITTPSSINFYENGFSLGGVSWRDIVVSGTNSLSLTLAKADGLNYLKLFGGCIQSNLSKDYTELEYIQSDGTQYIDSGIIPASFDYEIETEFAFDSVNSSSTPLCAWGYMKTGTNPRWLLASYQSKYLLNVNATSAIGTSQDTSKHTFVGEVYTVDNTAYYSAVIDGETMQNNVAITLPTTFTSNTLSIYIFARNNDGTTGNFVSGKLYKHTVKKAGVKIQELIPAKRNSDDVIGLYDTVTDTFFTNDGTGTFTAGSAKTPSPDYPIDIVCNNGVVKYGRIGKNLFNPNAITENKYISNTGAETSDNSFAISDYINVSGASYITLSTIDTGAYPFGGSACKAFYDASKNYINNTATANSTISSTNPVTVAVPSGAVYFRISVKKSVKDKIQVEYGNTATTFVSYQEGIYTDGTTETVKDSLNNTATATDLYAVESYKDVQSVLDGNVTRNVGVRVFDGTEEDWG